jgi:hypothetical protein
LLELLDLDAAPVTVSDSGSAIWELLAAPISSAALLRRLAARFATRELLIEADVDTFLANLQHRGLIEISLVQDRHDRARPTPRSPIGPV